MALVQKAINGLYKGVTRQEESNRVEGQVAESINMMHTVENGIVRRNPTEFVKSLGTIFEDNFIHTYARGDGIEEYIIVIQNGSVQIFDTDGNPIQVNTEAEAIAYLTVQNPYKVATAFRALTVGDTTFIVNRTVQTEMSGFVEDDAGIEKANPFYWIKRSFDNGSGDGYNYTLDGYSTNSTKTTTACSTIANNLGINYENYGSIVVRTNEPETFTWSDSYGSQASEGFWGQAKKIEDLPDTMSGAEDNYTFLLEITGDPDNSFTNFWVKYEDDHWAETVKPNLPNIINPNTMPVRLVRNEVGEFDLTLIDYDPRKFGDENTASEPSFIGKNITDIFFFKNRLCFTSNENVIMSEVGEYYNFFPTTVTDILASDPIDVAVDSNTVSLLNHAVPFNDSVVLLSANGQFSLQAEKVLSPEDVSISSTTSYDAVIDVRPISLGNNLYFLSETLQGTSLREYYVDESGLANSAVDVSGHIRGYLPTNIISMAGNTNQDIIFMLSSNNTDTIFVYKYYTDGNERIQTAFSKWVFDGTIYNMSILEDYLYILIDRGYSVQLERLDYSSTENIVYMDNGTDEYLSEITLSQPVLKDGQGKLIQSARSPLMYRTLQLESTAESDYKVEITNKLRTRVAEGYAVKDNKIMVQGKSNEVTLKIQSVEDKPLEFHTYTTELNYNIRSKIV